MDITQVSEDGKLDLRKSESPIYGIRIVVHSKNYLPNPSL